jgi:hypothetical protein
MKNLEKISSSAHLYDDGQKGVLRGSGAREGVPPDGFFFFFLRVREREREEKRRVSFFPSLLDSFSLARPGKK